MNVTASQVNQYLCGNGRLYLCLHAGVCYWLNVLSSSMTVTLLLGLCVCQGADPDSIRRSYRRMASKCHPDKHRGTDYADAFTVIKPPQSRVNTLAFGRCYFPSTGRTKAGQPRYFPSMSIVDGKEDSLSAIFHPHGPTVFYSHTTYVRRTDA